MCFFHTLERFKFTLHQETFCDSLITLVKRRMSPQPEEMNKGSYKLGPQMVPKGPPKFQQAPCSQDPSPRMQFSSRHHRPTSAWPNLSPTSPKTRGPCASTEGKAVYEDPKQQSSKMWQKRAWILKPKMGKTADSVPIRPSAGPARQIQLFSGQRSFLCLFQLLLN